MARAVSKTHNEWTLHMRRSPVHGWFTVSHPKEGEFTFSHLTNARAFWQQKVQASYGIKSITWTFGKPLTLED